MLVSVPSVAVKIFFMPAILEHVALRHRRRNATIRPTCEPCRSIPTSTGSRAAWRPAASGPNDAIPPAELFALDQWHYHGTDAIRDAGAFLGLGPASRVLDIGSGIGGPARFLAHTTGCHVTALELQPELHRVGLDLTRRSGLEDRVTHLCGDALEQPPVAGEVFRRASSVSWRSCTSPHRPDLMKRVRDALRPGGRCYIEDLACRAPFTPR